jgi:hypothetical protein
MKKNKALRCGLCGGPCSDGSGVCLGCELGGNGWYPDERIDLTAEPIAFLCTVCHQNAVDAANGYDTCAECIARM